MAILLRGLACQGQHQATAAKRAEQPCNDQIFSIQFCKPFPHDFPPSFYTMSAKLVKHLAKCAPMHLLGQARHLHFARLALPFADIIPQLVKLFYPIICFCVQKTCPFSISCSFHQKYMLKIFICSKHVPPGAPCKTAGKPPPPASRPSVTPP